MSDPTVMKTCPCGHSTSVNQLGQHHHTDCRFQRDSGMAPNLWSTPGCCDDPSLSRVFFFSKDAGVECRSCGETWPGDVEAIVQACASVSTHTVMSFESGPVRVEVHNSIEREIRRHL